MRTNYILLAAALALATALPADAQARPWEHVPTRRAVKVTSFEPNAGAVGSLVTIHGKGFRDGTQVLMDGRPVALEMRSSRELRFRVPAYHGNGRLALDVPGRGAVPVGQFTVITMNQRAPVVSSVWPRRGAPGTRVVLRGRDLIHVSEVLLRGRSLPITRSLRTQIEVEIPHDAESGRFAVGSLGQMHETRFRFDVQRPPVKVYSVSPSVTRPGAELSIRGINFGTDARVLIGGHPAVTEWKSARELRVQVPHEVSPGSQTVRVMSGGVIKNAPRKLRVQQGLAITKLSTQQANAGSRVVIWGHGFDEHTRVFWGHRELRAQSLGSGRIEVFLPGDARGTSYLAVHDGVQRAQAPAPLRILASSPLPYEHPRDQIGIMY